MKPLPDESDIRARASLRLPDFIIGGAPKCGTTSLHFVLAQHRDIGIPDEEIHFFDADDPMTHPDFFFPRGGTLSWFDCRPGNEAALDWYASRFERFADRKLIGEDSTTYLLSPVAPERIKALLPDVRLVFMLRDPVARAYSQYWHLLKTCRTAQDFEKTLVRDRSIVLGSTYAPHIARYHAVFGRERVHVVLFEDFVREPAATLERVTRFLGAEPMPAPERLWYNRTLYPVSLSWQCRLNRIGRPIVRQRYANHMGGARGFGERVRRKLHYWWFEHVADLLLRADRPTPMTPETRRFLAQHLHARNAGLDDLLDRDLASIWPSFAEASASGRPRRATATEAV